MQRSYTIFNQPKIECSKLFKLKPDGDTAWNNSLVSHRKSEKLPGVNHRKSITNKSASRTELLKGLWRYRSYEYVESNLRRWEISSVHYKRGFSGPGYLGEFVEALFMWCWGLPLFSFVLHYFKCTWRLVWRHIFLFLLFSMFSNYVKTYAWYFMLGFPIVKIGSRIFI